MEAFGQGRAGIPAFRQFGDRGAGDYIKMEEMLMKKEAGFFLAMMCVLTLVGCGTSNNAEKAEDKISQSAVEESMASEEINVVSASGDTQEPVQDFQSEVDEPSQPEEKGYMDNEEQANSDVNVPETIDSEKDANVSSPLVGVTMEVTEYSDTSVSIRITNDTDKDIQCGSDFCLEMQGEETEEWRELDEVIDNAAFTMEAYRIQKDSSYETVINFEWLYGKLESGKYRIVKTVTDFRGTGDYTDYTYTAEFCIKEEM